MRPRPGAENGQHTGFIHVPELFHGKSEEKCHREAGRQQARRLLDFLEMFSISQRASSLRTLLNGNETFQGVPRGKPECGSRYCRLTKWVPVLGKEESTGGIHTPNMATLKTTLAFSSDVRV